MTVAAFIDIVRQFSNPLKLAWLVGLLWVVVQLAWHWRLRTSADELETVPAFEPRVSSRRPVTAARARAPMRTEPEIHHAGPPEPVFESIAAFESALELAVPLKPEPEPEPEADPAASAALWAALMPDANREPEAASAEPPTPVAKSGRRRRRAQRDADASGLGSLPSEV
jgi:hypothetical protein